LNGKILLSLKIILFLALSWFIINRLFLTNDFGAQFSFFMQHLQGGKIYLFVLAVLLMPVNWGLETIKWKMLLKSDAPYSELLRSIIAGITVGFVTPGRSGEFVGRILFLNEENKSKVFYLSSIGGMAQTAASLIIGVPFIAIWRSDPFLTGIVTGVGVVYLFAYFRFDLLNRLILSNSFLRRYNLVIFQEELPETGTQVYVLLLSLLRFISYLLQYVLLFAFFGLGSNYLALLVHGAVFLLAQTFSPLMPLLDVSYRGATALYVFKDFSTNNLAILSSVMVVWLINLVIPALMGYLFIFRKKPAAVILK
jgi:hypothetical protein